MTPDDRAQLLSRFERAQYVSAIVTRAMELYTHGELSLEEGLMLATVELTEQHEAITRLALDAEMRLPIQIVFPCGF